MNRKLRKKMLTMAQLNIIFALILGNVGFNILSLTTKVNVDYRNVRIKKSALNQLTTKNFSYLMSKIDKNKISNILNFEGNIFSTQLHL